jgi:hypothetical protein
MYLFFTACSFNEQYLITIINLRIVFRDIQLQGVITHTHTHSVALVRERTIPTERPTLDSEVIANFFRIEGATRSS